MQFNDKKYPVEGLFKKHSYPINGNLSDQDIFRKFISLIKEDFSGLGYYEIYEKFIASFGFNISPSFESLGGTDSIFRAVIYNEKEPTREISRVSYPDPLKWKVNRGRANLENVPVFYASNNTDAAIKEIKAVSGNKVILGTWKVIESRSLKICPILFNHQKLNGSYKLLISEAFNKLDDRGWFFLKLWDWLFVSENYPLSSSIAHKLLYDKSFVDLIIYPSIADNSENINYAIKTHLINDKTVIPVSFEYILIQSVVINDITGIVLGNGVPTLDNKIEWTYNPCYSVL